MTVSQDAHTLPRSTSVDSDAGSGLPTLTNDREILLCRSALREQSPRGFEAILQELSHGIHAELLPQIVLARAFGSVNKEMYAAGLTLLQARPYLHHSLFCVQVAFRSHCHQWSDDRELRAQQNVFLMLNWGVSFREYEMELRGKDAERRGNEISSLVLDTEGHALARVSYGFLADPSPLVRRSATNWILTQVKAGSPDVLHWALIASMLCAHDIEMSAAREELLDGVARALGSTSMSDKSEEEARIACAEISYAESTTAGNAIGRICHAQRALWCGGEVEDEVMPILIEGLTDRDALIRRGSITYLSSGLHTLSERQRRRALDAIARRLTDPDWEVAVKAFRQLAVHGRAEEQFCHLGSFLARADAQPSDLVAGLKYLGNARHAITDGDAVRCLGIVLTLMRHSDPVVARAAFRSARLLARWMGEHAGLLTGMWELGDARLRCRVLVLIEDWQKHTMVGNGATRRVYEVLTHDRNPLPPRLARSLGKILSSNHFRE